MTARRARSVPTVAIAGRASGAATEARVAPARIAGRVAPGANEAPAGRVVIAGRAARAVIVAPAVPAVGRAGSGSTRR